MYVVESNRNPYLTNIPVLGKVPVFCWFSPLYQEKPFASNLWISSWTPKTYQNCLLSLLLNKHFIGIFIPWCLTSVKSS